MKIDDKIRGKKLQHDIKREAAEVPALSSGKSDKYEYLTGEEILPSNRTKITEQAKFAYSPSGKALEKQIEKQVGALKFLKLANRKYGLKQIEGVFPQNLRNDFNRDKLKEIINLQNIIRMDKLHYKSKRGKVYNFSEYYLPIVF